jgi:hypothetical protein
VLGLGEEEAVEVEEVGNDEQFQNDTPSFLVA